MLFELSKPVAVSVCCLFSGMFVGSLYLVPKRIRDLDRDDPLQIKCRSLCVSLVSIVCPGVLYLLGDKQRGETTLLEWIGVRQDAFALATVLPVSLVIVLFTGHLVHLWHQFTPDPSLTTLENFFPNLPTEFWVKMRNIAIAPLAEEIVFRGCMTPLMICSGMGFYATLFIPPAVFGFAHVHHAYGFLREGVPLNQVAISVLVQFTYTTLFGALEMYFFLRTGHLVSVFLIHAWCNMLGLPSLQCLQSHHKNYKHRKVIMGAYGVGILAFLFGLAPGTHPVLYESKLFNEFTMRHGQ